MTKRQLVSTALSAFAAAIWTTMKITTATAAGATLPAPAIETPDAIRSAIAAALQPRLGSVGDASFDIGALDARLRLASCSALDVSVPTAIGAAMTAKVECQTPNWTIYVPVRVHAWTEAVVAATNLAPNTRLTAAALTRGRIDMFGANGGLITDPGAAEGKILRAGIVAGSPILDTMLDQPIVVHRGEKLLLTLTDGDMELRDSVVALEDGRTGDTISLQNEESHKTIRATVTGSGAAEIRF